MFVSSMTQWLQDHECAEIERLEQTDNLCSVPRGYSDYEDCVRYIRNMELIGATLWDNSTMLSDVGRCTENEHEHTLSVIGLTQEI